MKSIAAHPQGRSLFALAVPLLLCLILIGSKAPSAFGEEPKVATRGDFGNITVMELTGNFDAKLPDGTNNSAPRKALAREFYRTHRDDYDFLIFFTNFDYRMLDADTAGFYTEVKNDIRGIGIDLFDLSDLFGSSGRLQGTIDMRSLAVNGASPLDPLYTQTLNTLEHEILHRWGAHARFVGADGNISNALLGRDAAHWSYLLDSNASLHYGSDWRDNGDGTFTAVATRQGFSPLDLYLMGMIDKSEVPPLKLIENPAIDPTRYPELGATVSGTASVVTIEDIIAALGERLPAAADAPKSFKAAFVFVTRPGTFSSSDLYGLEQIRNGFLTRFSILTDGQGLVQVTPTLKPDLPVNPGTTPTTEVPRTLPPSLDEGVAWLRNNQSAEGSWADTEQTTLRDTAEALAALGSFGAEPGLSHGIEWLSEAMPGSNDYLSRRLEALALTGSAFEPAAAALLERQNLDGGWGSSSVYQSNPMDTALALRALVRAGKSATPAATRAANYLAGEQNPDGGWGARDAFSMVQPTAHALVALKPFAAQPLVTASLERGRSFLLGKQNADGGFGNSPSTIYDSSAALLALGEVGGAVAPTQRAVTYLENHQTPEGSWYDSPFQTAAAVRAIWAGTITPDLVVKAGDVTFIPTQIFTLPTNTTIAAKVWNNGRTEVPAVAVALYRDSISPANLVERQIIAVPGLTPVVATFSDRIEAPGSHTYLVVVDADQQVPESDEENNQATAVLNSQANHDFVVASADVVTSASQTVLGETISVDFTVYNRGTEAVSGLPVALTIGPSPGRIVDTLLVDIPAGKSIRGKLNWQVDQAGTNLPLAVTADPDNLLRESDEENNSAATTLTVLTAALQADLRVAAESISFNPATVTILPTAAEAVVVVANAGQTAISQAAIALYVGTPSGGAPIGSQSVNIPALSSVEVRFPVSITSGNNQLFTVVADPDRKITEWREDNNQASASLPVAAQHDFYVDAAQIAVLPQPANVGAPVTVSARIGNQGTVAAYNVQARFTVQAEGQTLTIATLTFDLPAGEAVTRSFEWTPAVAGQGLTLAVEVDPFQQFAELSEINNRATRSIDINGWSLPNLTAAHQNLTVSPSPANERGAATIQALIANNGYAAAANVRVDFYEGIPGYGGHLLGTTQVPQIAASGSAPVSVAWPDIMVAGEKLIYVVVDPANQITEIDETDNDNFTELKILALPDLLVEAGAITVNPAMPSAGSAASVTVTVRNSGEQPTGPVTVQLLDGQKVLAETTLPLVKGLSQQSATLPIETSGRDGENRLSIMADPAGLVLEQREDNNAADFSFAVQNGDFWLTYKYISPNGDGIQDNTTLYFRLNAPQSFEVRIVNAEGTVVRQLTDPQWENADYGQAFWDGLDDVGRVVDDGVYRMQIVNRDDVQIGMAQVVVDINRSPIIEAIGTPYFYLKNMGKVPNGAYFEELPDESGYLIYVDPDSVAEELSIPGLYLWEPENNTVELLTPPDWNITISLSYVVSPDGSSVAVVYYKYDIYSGISNGHELWIIDLKSRKLQKVDESNKFTYYDPYYGDVSGVGYIYAPVFSADGKILAYSIQTGYEQVSWDSYIEYDDTRVVNLGTFERNTLYSGTSTYYADIPSMSLSWSPLGNELVFASSGKIWRARQQTGSSLPVIDPLSIATGAPLGWSPDGDKLAFVEYDINQYSGPIRISVYESTTGTRIVYEGRRPDRFEGWLNNTDILVFKGGERNSLVIGTENSPMGVPVYQTDEGQLVGRLFRSPDNKYLLFINNESVLVYDVTGRRIVNKSTKANVDFYDVVWDQHKDKVYVIGPTNYTDDYLYYDYRRIEIDLVSGKTISHVSDDEGGLSEIENYDPRELRLVEEGYGRRRALFEGALFSLATKHLQGIYFCCYTNFLYAVDPSQNQLSIELANHSYIRDFGVSPLGRYLSYTATEDAYSYNYNLYRAQSLLNLIAELHAVKTSSGIEVKGSVTDLNFAGFRLEYANLNDPENWTLLQAGSDKPLVDQTLTTWVPPQEGTFRLRLTSWDLAGNSAVDEERVVWGDTLSIANLAQSETFISPNNDQVKDSVTLSYRVLFPMYLEFRILDADDRVVRTIQRDHTLIGQQSIVWDGRDDSGVVVSDGTYRIAVFDYRFSVVVDSTPPQSSLGFGPFKFDFDNDSASVKLFGQTDDRNLKRWTIERGLGSDPAAWVEYAFGKLPLSNVNAVEEFSNEALQANAGYQFRLTVEDYAGNRSTSVAGFLPGRLVLFNADSGPPTFNTESLRPSGHHNLLAVSTFAPAVSDLQVECRVKSTWTASPSSINQTVSGLRIDWDSAPCGAYANSVRLKGATSDGQIVTSNEMVYRDVFDIRPSCPASYSVENWLFEELVDYQAQYQEPWSEKWIKYLDLGPAHVGSFDIPPPDFMKNGENFFIRVIGRGAQTGKVYQTPRQQLFCDGDDDDGDDDGISGGGISSTPSGCGLVVGTRRFSMPIVTETLPVKLQVFLADTAQELLLGEIDNSNALTVDVSKLAEGLHTFRMAYSYRELLTGTVKQVEKLIENYWLDLTLPTAAIRYPIGLIDYCPGSPGELFGGLPAFSIEGVVADTGGVAKYEVTYRPENSQASGSWQNTGVQGTKASAGGLGTWNPGSLEPGTYALKLMVQDQSGNMSCTQSSMVIGSPVAISLLEADQSVISPNGDGFKDNFRISYRIASAAFVDLVVLSGTQTVRHLQAGVYHSGGTAAVVWDGKDDAGQTVGDGAYTIKLKSSDSCQYPDEKSLSVEVHSTPPYLEFTAPNSLEPLGILVEIKGTVTDSYLTGYKLEVGAGVEPTEWTTVGSGSVAVSDQLLATWNTFGREGAWTLRLSGEDSLKNRSEMRRTLNLVERGALIKNLDANPKLFSPNGDGILEISTIGYELTAACLVDLEVIGAEGKKVMRRKSVDVLAAGLHQEQWDGHDEATGQPLSSGEYTLVLTATLPENQGITHQEHITLHIDVTPPDLKITQPEEGAYFSKAAIPLVGTIADPHFEHYAIRLQGTTGTQLISEGSSGLKERQLGMLSDLAAGIYTVNVDAIDVVGNRTEMQRNFTVDRTPPQVKFLQPLARQLFGRDQGRVMISGEIVEENPERYGLRYRRTGSVEPWIVLSEGAVPSALQVNYVWNVGSDTGIADGDYELSLWCRDRAGQETETLLPLTADNAPPEVAFVNVADGSYVRGGDNVIGTIKDATLELATIELASGACASDLKWSPLRQFKTSVEQGKLYTWNLLPGDGNYCLKLAARDRLSSHSEIKVNFVIDTNPPAAPILSGEVVARSSARLSWSTVVEADLAGYRLYRNGELLNPTMLAETGYVDENLRDGSYRYQVKAIDLAGNESALSAPVTLAIDLLGPLANIVSPANNGKAQGTVAIRGTAFSSDDFREYRVFVGSGTAPTTWTQIRRSPVPISFGVLANWDTQQLPETTYTIKLEAEDLAGNVTTSMVEVTIDNTPPQAPFLVSAEASGADVTVFWNENAESDFGGYLLFRNGQLANASGTVVGDWKPYLLKTTSFTDVGLVDGTYSYFAVGMDRVGNLSAQSNVKDVTIDLRTPRAEIVDPVDAAQFDQALTVTAKSEDLDIATVRFQYRTMEEELWRDLGAVLVVAPFVTSFDPEALSLPFGVYQLRAVATDRAGHQDPTPLEISVEYRDLTPPAVPEGLKASSLCNAVTLSWNADSDNDLDGYNIYISDNGMLTRLNGSPHPAPTWIETGLSEGQHNFVVTAVDLSGNESRYSGEATIQLLTPAWSGTNSVTGEAKIDLAGNNAYANARVQLLANDIAIAEALADASGGFSFPGVDLANGANAFTLVAVEAAGNKSCESEPLVITRSKSLPPPTGLQAVVSGFDVQLSWQPVDDPEFAFAYYQIYRDGGQLQKPLLQVPVAAMTASADSYFASNVSSNAIDGKSNTYWISANTTVSNWLQINFNQSKVVRKVDIIWSSTSRGKNFEIQIRNGTKWQTVSQFVDNTSISNTLMFDRPYSADGVRLYVTASNNPNKTVGVSEFKIWEKPGARLTSYTERLTSDGTYNYQVSSVNRDGLEGPLSTALPVAVGDTEPPAPPVNLTATAQPGGRSVLLAWESASSDTHEWNIYRSNTAGGPYTRLATQPSGELSLIDQELANGTAYYYVITALDSIGNESAYSQEVVGVPQGTLPPQPPSLFYPTIPGRDKVVDQRLTVIKGLTDADVTVQLFADDQFLGAVRAQAVPETDTKQLDKVGYKAAMSSTGTYLAYWDVDRYEDLMLRNLVTGKETLVEKSIGSFVWSGDGSRIIYQYYDQDWNSYLAMYLVDSGEKILLTPSANLESPSTSADGNIVAYVGDHKLWVKNLQTDTTTQFQFGWSGGITAVAPDGSKIAYYDRNYGLLYVINPASAETVEIGIDSPSNFEWSPDSRLLTYSTYSYITGGSNIYVYDSSTASVSQVTDTETSKFFLHWSPDGKSVVFAQVEEDDSQSIRTTSIRGEQVLLVANLVSVSTLQWQPSGEVVYIDNDSSLVNYLLPSGFFTFNSVPLTAGENRFSATSTDVDGNVSPASEAISIVFDTGLIPDVAVAAEDLFMFPAVPAPGERVLADATIRNLSRSAVNLIDVDIYLLDSLGELRLLETQTLDHLSANGSATVSVSFVAPSETAGTATLLVVVDPRGRIDELLENNNFAYRDFRVSDAKGVELSVSLNADQFTSHQEVGINLELLNNDQMLHGQLQVLIEDAAGNTAATLKQIPVDLIYGLTDFAFRWDTGVSFAGDYQVHVLLHDNQGQLVAEQRRPFVILPDEAVNLEVTTNRTNYDPNQSVEISIELDNAGENSIITTLQVRTKIFDSVGNELYATEPTLSNLFPGSTSRLVENWNTALIQPGIYEIRVEAIRAGQVLRSASKPFEINAVGLVQGSLTADPREAIYGIAFQLPFTLENRGNLAAEGRLTVSLFAPIGLEPVAVAEQNVSLPVAARVKGLFPFVTTGLDLQTYRAQLHFVTASSSRMIAETTFRVIDGIAPSLTVEAPTPAQSYRQRVEFAATANDDISGVASVSYRLDGGAWQVMPVSAPATGRFAVSWAATVADNGTHTVEFLTVDRAGNRRQTEPFSYEVQMDTIPPVTTLEIGPPQYLDNSGVLNLAGESHLSLVAADNLGSVAGTEFHIDSGSWNPYTGPVSLSGITEGEHVFGFRSIDAVGNVELEKTRKFVLDNAAPVTAVTLDGVHRQVDGLMIVSTATRVQLAANDTYSGVKTTEYRIDGGAWQVYTPFQLADAGTRIIEFRSMDRLGHIEQTQTLTLAVDLNPPETSLVAGSPHLKDGSLLYVTPETTLELSAKDGIAGVEQTEYRIDGGDWISYVPFALSVSGPHLLEYRSMDAVGNQENIQYAQLLVDNDPPQAILEIGTPQVNGVADLLYVASRTPLRIVAEDSGSGISRIEHQIDSGPWYAGAIVELPGAGEHSISWRAFDRLGHVSAVVERRLVLDDGAPHTTCILVGPQYNEGVHHYANNMTSLELTATDDLSGLRGIDYRFDDGDWNAATGAVSLTTLNNGPHTIRYRAIDQLGNSEPEQVLTLTIDNVPPETRLTVGMPQVSVGETLYVSPVSIFTLSASDTLVGLANTEVSIDGGIWVPYQPFTLSGSGMHIVEYRSRDRLDNLEAVKFKAATVDDISPVVTIAAGEPRYSSADGKLYVGPQTPFLVFAEDSLSGVEHIEYRTDGGSWTPYVPFTLTAEGTYVVEVKASDRTGNEAPHKTLSVVTDATPPKTGVTFDGGSFLDGERLIVGEETHLVLTASDTLSGIGQIYYRFDDQEQWINYEGPVSLADLPVGYHRLQVRSLDNVANLESAQTISVNRMSLNFISTPVTVPRVLVWLPDEGDDRSGHPNEFSDTEAEHLLASVFAGRDAYYTVVRNEDDFVRELRSGVYNVLALLDPDEPVNAHILGEIRAAVRRGTGLVAASWKQELHPQLQDIFGVTPNGRKQLADEGETAFLFEEPLGVTGTPNLIGTVQRVKLAGGQLAGVIPAPEICEGVRSVSLHLPVALAIGDRIDVRLGRKERLLEQESWTVTSLPGGPIDQTDAGVDGNLVLTGLTASGLDLSLIASYGDLGKAYTLSLTIERSGSGLTSFSGVLSGDCSANLQPGVMVGPFQVVTLEAHTEKQEEDLPIVIVNHFGLGAAVLLTYDPFLAAKTYGVDNQATLLGGALAWTTPVQEGPKAAGILLLDNRFDLVGIAGGLTLIETPGPGLTSPSLFDLPSAPFSRNFSLVDKTGAEYRYLVRFADSTGIFKKETELYYQFENEPILVRRQLLQFEVTETSSILLDRALAWVEERLAAGLVRDDRLEELRQCLISISILRWDSEHDLKQVLMLSLEALNHAETLAGSADNELLVWLSDYLRIAEVAWYDTQPVEM